MKLLFSVRDLKKRIFINNVGKKELYKVIKQVRKNIINHYRQAWSVTEISFLDKYIDNKYCFNIKHADTVYRFLRRYKDVNIEYIKRADYAKIVIKL